MLFNAFNKSLNKQNEVDYDINRHERLSLDGICVYKWAKRLYLGEGSHHVSRGKRCDL